MNSSAKYSTLALLKKIRDTDPEGGCERLQLVIENVTFAVLDSAYRRTIKADAAGSKPAGQVLKRNLTLLRETYLPQTLANDVTSFNISGFVHGWISPIDTSRFSLLLWVDFTRAYSMTPYILRRLGPDPHADGAQTVSLNGCPDILELANGDFAVIGVDITQQALSLLPPTVGCGPDERIVRIPRKTLVLAKPDIPTTI